MLVLQDFVFIDENVEIVLVRVDFNLKGFLCFEGESVVNLFLPPVAVEERVADDSGAGEARVKVESDLVSRIREQINFKHA